MFEKSYVLEVLEGIIFWELSPTWNIVLWDFGSYLRQIFGAKCWGTPPRHLAGDTLSIYIGQGFFRDTIAFFCWLSSKEHTYRFWVKKPQEKTMDCFFKTSTRATLISKLLWEILFQKSWKSRSVVERSQSHRRDWGSNLVAAPIHQEWLRTNLTGDIRQKYWEIKCKIIYKCKYIHTYIHLLVCLLIYLFGRIPGGHRWKLFKALGVHPTIVCQYFRGICVLGWYLWDSPEIFFATYSWTKLATRKREEAIKHILASNYLSTISQISFK